MPWLIPVAANVAICLFVVKETFEFFRRAGERRRKLIAIKEILQHEVYENYRVLNCLFFAIDSTKRDTVAPDERDTIIFPVSGGMRYERVDTNGTVVLGNPIPATCMTEFKRLLPSTAELDRNLYSAIRRGYDQVYQIEHIHKLFVDLLTGSDREFLSPFRTYADSHYSEIAKSLSQLYTLLTGRELDYKGLQRSPTNPK